MDLRINLNTDNIKTNKLFINCVIYQPTRDLLYLINDMYKIVYKCNKPQTTYFKNWIVKGEDY